MKPRHAGAWITPAFAAHVERDRHLEQALEAQIGASLRAGRLALTLRGETLIAICADRGLATELRFMQRDLLKALQAAGYSNTTGIRIRLSHSPRSPQPTSPRVPREIPAPARTLLQRTAQTIDDSDLAQALERLAVAGTRHAAAD